MKEDWKTVAVYFIGTAILLKCIFPFFKCSIEALDRKKEESKGGEKE